MFDLTHKRVTDNFQSRTKKTPMFNNRFARMGTMVLVSVLAAACGNKESSTAGPVGEGSAAVQQKTSLVALSSAPAQTFAVRFEVPAVDPGEKSPAQSNLFSAEDKEVIDAFMKAILMGACNKADAIAAKADKGGPAVSSLQMIRQVNRAGTALADIKSTSDKLHALADEAHIATIAYNAIYLEGFIAKNPTTVPATTLVWGLSHGLKRDAIVSGYLNGARRAYSGAAGCRAFMVAADGVNKSKPFVEGLYKANQDYLKKLQEYTPSRPNFVKGEFENTVDFEARKVKETADYEISKASFENDRANIAMLVASQALSSNLPPLELKDLIYDADKQSFTANLTTGDGSVKIPVQINSSTEQAPRDKDELLADAKLSQQIRLEADGELVVEDFQIETKNLRLMANTVWKTGFRFGEASDALYSKVQQERAIDAASRQAAAQKKVEQEMAARRKSNPFYGTAWDCGSGQYRFGASDDVATIAVGDRSSSDMLNRFTTRMSGTYKVSGSELSIQLNTFEIVDGLPADMRFAFANNLINKPMNGFSVRQFKIDGSELTLKVTRVTYNGQERNLPRNPEVCKRVD